MPVEISIHTALRSCTGGKPVVRVEAGTVTEALETLTAHDTQREQTPQRSGDNLTIVPSIAGG